MKTPKPENYCNHDEEEWDGEICQECEIEAIYESEASLRDYESGAAYERHLDAKTMYDDPRSF